MLYLTRKTNESIIINDNIEVTVVEIRGKSVKLGFEFPPSATVFRREIYDRIQQENKAAATPEGISLKDIVGATSATVRKPDGKK